MGMRKQIAAVLVSLAISLPHPVAAIDPPYEPQMERLAEIMGSLYFLMPLCSPPSPDWRAELADLVAKDQPDEDRQQRLYGSFNSGYQAFARLYRGCTPSAREAMTRLLVEAEAAARDIHTRYSE